MTCICNLLIVLRQSWRNPIFFFLGGGDKFVFFTPQKKHLKIFANFCAQDPKFFLVEQKLFCNAEKKSFGWKTKNDKNISFENFEIAKTGQRVFSKRPWNIASRNATKNKLQLRLIIYFSSFLTNPLCGQKHLQILMWFGLSFSLFVPPKCFLISKKTKRSRSNSFELKQMHFSLI